MLIGSYFIAPPDGGVQRQRFNCSERSQSSYALATCIALLPFMQQITDRAVGHRHAEAGLHYPLEIDPAPAHYPVRRHVKTRFHDPIELRLLLGAQQTGPGRAQPFQETRHPFGVVAVDPVPWCLSAVPQHSLPPPVRPTLQNRGNRQAAPGLSHAPAQPRRATLIISQQSRGITARSSGAPTAHHGPRESHQTHNVTLNESDTAAVG